MNAVVQNNPIRQFQQNLLVDISNRGVCFRGIADQQGVSGVVRSMLEADLGGCNKNLWLTTHRSQSDLVSETVITV